jgi:acetylornithine deacetylase/succinyl-diaminopimelate desuccinylase-like protein
MKLAAELGFAHRRMTSGAGHDAMEFARAGVPTLMVFVPSKGGISHSPDEFTTPGALFTGYRFTRDLAQRIAAREGGG